jgi:thiamine biosynthesis lipoprotein
VTVHATSCLVAGSATTVAMLKRPRDGVQWLDSLGLPYLCMLEGGEVVNRFEKA